MKSILIVDDEYYIRIRVRNCVDWQGLGFNRVVDCENAAEALALMQAQPFDLIVLDISMPLMDGLALTREIRAQGYASEIIILTGYEKFEYAKTALSLDVSDYILKPVDSEEMEKAVQRALGRIEQIAAMEDRIREHAALESQAKQMKTDLFFGSILTDSFLECPTAAAQLSAYGIDAERRYCVVYAQAVGAPEPLTLPHVEGARKIRLPQGFAWIIEEKDIGKVVEHLRMAALQTPFDTAFGVSVSHVGTPRELHLAYKEAFLIGCQRLLEPSNAVFCYTDYAGDRNILGAEKLKAYQDSYLAALRDQNSSRIEAALGDIFDCMTDSRNCVFGFYLLVESLLSDVQRSSVKTDADWDKSVFFRMQALEMIRINHTLDALKRQLADISVQSMSKGHNFATTAGTLLVKRIRRMVDNHYLEADMSLNCIAHALSMNASYLSDAFKRFSGQTISQYITQVRMEKAKELLSSGSASILEVSQQVGYPDPYYFSKRFKKYFGFPPSVCREH